MRIALRRRVGEGGSAASRRWTTETRHVLPGADARGRFALLRPADGAAAVPRRRRPPARLPASSSESLEFALLSLRPRRGWLSTGVAEPRADPDPRGGR